MLTSITPLGERGRGNRFGVTRAWLWAGHVLGGFALGGLLALLGALSALALRPSDETAVLLLAVGAGVAVVGDLTGVVVPGRRQVDERWLTTYRGWVYGLGFGVQLGFGLATVVNTLLLGVVLLAGVLLSPIEGLALGVVYGVTRGVGATLNGRIRTVSDLRRLHQRLDLRERAVRSTLLFAVIVAAAGSVVAA